MPTYEYECPKCGTFERFQSMSDEPLKRCPTCRSKVEKLISGGNFLLKGGGWYADGYEKKSAAKSTTKTDTAGTSTSSTESTSTSKSSSPSSTTSGTTSTD